MSRSISDKEWKLLIASSGGYCAFPGCDRHLVEHSTSPDSSAFLGEFAHIVASSRQGPRGRSTMNDEDRDRHSNLILLCSVHHKIIDDQPRTYSVPVLQQMKRDHEARIRKPAELMTASTATKQPIETLHSTLLPVTHLPEAVFVAPTAYKDGEEEQVRAWINYPTNRDELAPYLLRQGSLFAFHDLRDPRNPFAAVTSCSSAEVLRTTDFWSNAEGRRRFVTLLNRAMYKYTARLDIRYDPSHYRFFFPVLERGSELSVSYHSLTGRRSSRKVAWEPQRRSTGEGKGFWFHMAAGLRFHQMDSTQWCLSIRPERHLTQDGFMPLPSRQIGRRLSSLKARMYNDLYLAEVNFWREYLSNGQPRIILNFGHQSAVIDGKFIEFGIRWPGISGDDKPFSNQVGLEDLFSWAEFNRVLEGEQIDWDELGEEDLEADYVD